jgi:hypothetical protein
MGDGNKNHKELERLVEILQDKERTGISAEGTCLVLKIGLNKEIKELFETILWEPNGIREPWFKLDYGEVCQECLSDVVFEGHKYCPACAKERSRRQKREYKRRKREAKIDSGG